MLYTYNMSGNMESDNMESETDSTSDATFDSVFKALSTGTRRRILDLLKDHPRTTGELCASFPELDRCTTMQHLDVLEHAGLVIAQRKGRVRWNHLDALPIKLIHDRWIGDYARSAVELLASLKSDLELTST